MHGGGQVGEASAPDWVGDSPREALRRKCSRQRVRELGPLERVRAARCSGGAAAAAVIGVGVRCVGLMLGESEAAERLAVGGETPNPPALRLIGVIGVIRDVMRKESAESCVESWR